MGIGGKGGVGGGGGGGSPSLNHVFLPVPDAS